MTEETKNPLDDKVLTLKFTVAEINGLLNVLGNAPFSQSVWHINAIQTQCASQLGEDSNESKATS